MGKTYYLSDEDRQKILEMWEKGYNAHIITLALGRSNKTIYEEIRRGYTGKTLTDGRPEYDPELAKQRMAESIERRGRWRR